MRKAVWHGCAGCQSSPAATCKADTGSGAASRRESHHLGESALGTSFS